MNSLFLLFASGSWISAALLLRSKNPVHSVFYLVLIFLHSSGLLLLLGLEYFALLQLLVYVGALAILFLFVVMLLDIPATEIVAHQRGTRPVAFFFALSLGLSTFLAIWQPSENSPFQSSYTFLSFRAGDQNSYSWERLSNGTSHLSNLGVALYGMHVDLLLLASFLLLVAMIGAVALTLKRRVRAPVYDVYSQHYRDFQKVTALVQSTKV
uniref:NADH-ubiquinone oxidoreductase chain 6 n=1 Tax=Rotundella rotunda TaxID=1357779 RepID=A0A076YFD3_9CHLO|nr:NADH dehydrogenase subunit 6 [Rotundella rotunda]